MKKRVLSLLLCLAFLLVLLPAATRADGDCGDNLAWSFDDTTGKLTITGTGDMWDWSYSNTPWEAYMNQITSVELPEGLTTIGGRAFCGTKITGIEIPGTVTAIAGSYAFSGCTGLKQITFPGSLTSIGQDAFSGCTGLTSLAIPGSVIEIDSDAFSGCSGITLLTLNKGIQKIQSYAFKNCTGLTTLTIPDGVEEVGLGAFMGCTGLTSVTMPCDTWLYNAPTYPVFEGCTAISTVRLTPGKAENQGVMRQTNMYDVWRTTGVDVSVTLDEGVQAINHRSFRDAVRLKSIKLPNSLLVIGNGAFMGCTGLTTIDVPNSVEIIGEGAFSGCTGLTSFVWPEPANTAKMTTVAQQMFMDCTNLASITLPARVREIDNSAFLHCSNLKDVYYLGTREQKENMLIRNSNGPLLNAVWHFVNTALTIVTQPKDAKVKSGAAAKFSVKMKEKEVSYQWYTRPNGNEAWTLMDGETKATLTVVGAKANNGSQYCCRIANMYGNHVDSDIVNLNVTLDVPVVKTQPKDAKVKSGSNAKFTVKASGKNLVYTWYEWLADADGWTVVAGETKVTLIVPATMAKNGSRYYCRVENGDGNAASLEATLTVTPVPLSIKTHPKATMTVKSGSKVKLSVKAAGPNPQYQWRRWDDEAKTWTDMDGQTKADCTFTATMADNGARFCCKVWDADGGEEQSREATLTVTPQPASVKTSPKNAKAKSGAKAKFTVKAAGPNVEYQWYVRADENAPWAEVDGATAATYTFTAAMACNGRQYRCHVWNADGDEWSAEATLTVTPAAPKFSTQPKDAKVKAGDQAAFTVKASGVNVEYQWYYRTSKEGEWVLMDGETNATLTVQAGEDNFGWQFRCTAAAEGLTVDSKIVTLKKK